MTRTGRGVPTTPAQRQKRQRWFGIKPEFVTAAAVVIAVAMMVTATLVADFLRGSGDQPATTFMISGQIQVSGSSSNLAFGGSVGECRGKAGYEDLREGAQVVVAAATGRTIAIGRLGAGKSTTVGGDGSVARLVACTFPITIQDVPDGEDFYKITVTHRGTQEYSRDQLRKPISLTLG